MTDERENVRRGALERARAARWNALGRARVEHPERGTVVVPHSSNLAALMNAAEYWGCGWNEIKGARVWKAELGDGPVVGPRELRKNTRR